MPRLRAAPLLLLICGIAHAQRLDISPAAVKLTQVEGGPLASAPIEIRALDGAPRDWTASAVTSSPDDPWIELSAKSGASPATLRIGLVDWRGSKRPPGKYAGKVVIQWKGGSETIPIEWEVRPAVPPPAFRYLQGPNACSPAEGYPDPPLCTPLPLTAFSGPPPPGTAYKDPNFGAQVRVVTGPKVEHGYSTPCPLSAHNRYLITHHDDGTWDVLDAADGRVLVRRTQCKQGCFWDAFDDDTYYSLDAAAILKHEVRANKTSTLIDYSKQSQAFREIRRGGTGDTSKDNWISFWAPGEKQLCAVDLSRLKTYCADYSASQGRLPYGDIDFSLITKGIDKTTGKRYVMLIAPPAMGIFSVDIAAGVLRPEFRGPEDIERNGNRNGVCEPGERCFVGSHVDTLEDSAGIQYLVMDAETLSPCEVSLSTYQLNKGVAMAKQVELGGGRRKVMSLWRCGPGWVDEHVGCAKNAPYCVISTQNMPRPAGAPKASPTPHAGEVFVMRGNGEEIRRLVLTRSALFPGAGDDNYWSTPRAAISNDASLVVSDSNFGERAAPRVTIIETGIGGSAGR